MKSHDILIEPIDHTEIEWRVQVEGKDGKHMTVVPYITNRCVMNRFDAAFDPFGWTSEIREIQGGFVCRLSVLIDGKWIYREDGASKTHIEPEKGGISDAMKRCAVQFGLGRSLYDYPRVQIAVQSKFIPNWAYPKLKDMVKWINDGKCDRDYILLENK
jgi:hypothetical protein